MINITEEKLRAAIQIALVGECENADKTEAKLMHDIKALSITNVSNQRELLIAFTERCNRFRTTQEEILIDEIDIFIDSNL